MAKDFKRVERAVAAYLGGTRDWSQLHDCSVDGYDGATWIVEVKSHEWVSGPGGLWRRLEGAREQVVQAMANQGLMAGDWCYPLVVYWPTRCPRDGSALAYLPYRGAWVVMPLREFRARFITGERA